MSSSSAAIVCYIDGFAFTKTENFKFQDNTYILGQIAGPELNIFDIEFVQNIGLIQWNKLHEHHKILYQGDVAHLHSITKLTNIQEAGNILCGSFSYFVNALWFVKDNNCYIPMGYLLVEGPNGFMISIQNANFTTNSIGERTVESFSTEDLEQARKVHETFDLLFGKEEFSEIPINGGTQVVDPTIGRKNYTNGSFNRIERTYHILTKARNTSNLHEKISFYAATLECLFGINSSELNFRVCQRATLYIGGTKEEMITNNKLFKDCYNIRSKYFHGSTPPKEGNTRVKLQTISIKADSLLRIIFNNVLFVDSAIFLGKDDLLQSWLDEQLFEKFALGLKKEDLS